jgi:hypothetical protein
MSNAIPAATKANDLQLSWKETSTLIDERNVEHIRVQQLLDGLPIARQEIILHVRNGMLRDLNGYAWTGPLPELSIASLDAQAAITIAKNHLAERNIRFTNSPMNHQLSTINHHSSPTIRQTWFPKDGALRLAYEIDIHPNSLDFWKLYVDANTSDVLLAYPQHCSIFPAQLYENNADRQSHEEKTLAPGEDWEAMPTGRRALIDPGDARGACPATAGSMDASPTEGLNLQSFGQAARSRRAFESGLTNSTLADGPTMIKQARARIPRRHRLFHDRCQPAGNVQLLAIGTSQ